MRSIFILLISLACVMLSAQAGYTIVVHGGAGNGLKPENVSPQRQEAYTQGVEKALQRGAAVLDSGADALTAVVEVLSVLENDSVFNAGRGAVLTYEGEVSLDASLMNGQNLEAGAVSGVQRVKNPIQAAYAVLQHSPHVLLSGSGADEFARLQQLELVSPSYFLTQKSQRALKRYKARFGLETSELNTNAKMGTVGCAILDKNGNLAAGTSTGGMTGKRYGRIGDSPIIGAGTYANNATCAISCTGHGEFFMRYSVAYDVHARMAYKKQSGSEAAQAIVHEILKPAGGNGGLIGLTQSGQIIMEFNTSGMIRGYLKEGQTPVTAIFKD